MISTVVDPQREQPYSSQAASQASLGGINVSNEPSTEQTTPSPVAHFIPLNATRTGFVVDTRLASQMGNVEGYSTAPTFPLPDLPGPSSGGRSTAARPMQPQPVFYVPVPNRYPIFKFEPTAEPLNVAGTFQAAPAPGALAFIDKGPIFRPDHSLAAFGARFRWFNPIPELRYTVSRAFRAEASRYPRTPVGALTYTRQQLIMWRDYQRADDILYEQADLTTMRNWRPEWRPMSLREIDERQQELDVEKRDMQRRIFDRAPRPQEWDHNTIQARRSLTERVLRHVRPLRKRRGGPRDQSLSPPVEPFDLDGNDGPPLAPPPPPIIVPPLHLPAPLPQAPPQAPAREDPGMGFVPSIAPASILPQKARPVNKAETSEEALESVNDEQLTNNGPYTHNPWWNGMGTSFMAGISGHYPYWVKLWSLEGQRKLRLRGGDAPMLPQHGRRFHNSNRRNSPAKTTRASQLQSSNSCATSSALQPGTTNSSTKRAPKQSRLGLRGGSAPPLLLSDECINNENEEVQPASRIQRLVPPQFDQLIVASKMWEKVYSRSCSNGVIEWRWRYMKYLLLDGTPMYWFFEPGRTYHITANGRQLVSSSTNLPSVPRSFRLPSSSPPVYPHGHPRIAPSAPLPAQQVQVNSEAFSEFNRDSFDIAPPRYSAAATSSNASPDPQPNASINQHNALSQYAGSSRGSTNQASSYPQTVSNEVQHNSLPQYAGSSSGYSNEISSQERVMQPLTVSNEIQQDDHTSSSPFFETDVSSLPVSAEMPPRYESLSPETRLLRALEEELLGDRERSTASESEAITPREPESSDPRELNEANSSDPDWLNEADSNDPEWLIISPEPKRPLGYGNNDFHVNITMIPDMGPANIDIYNTPLRKKELACCSLEEDKAGLIKRVDVILQSIDKLEKAVSKEDDEKYSTKNEVLGEPKMEEFEKKLADKELATIVEALDGLIKQLREGKNHELENEDGFVEETGDEMGEGEETCGEDVGYSSVDCVSSDDEESAYRMDYEMDRSSVRKWGFRTSVPESESDSNSDSGNSSGTDSDIDMDITD